MEFLIVTKAIPIMRLLIQDGVDGAGLMVELFQRIPKEK
jgi:hypothetical protein